MRSITRFLLLASLLALPLSALAEKADRDKPVNLDADRITVDDVKKVQVFEGNVQLTQGTLIIRCDKLVVTQDADGFQSGVATGGAGGLARFRQRREGRDDYVDGEAERIVHDGKSERTEFFQRARIRSGNDEVRGQYISYDGKNETYLVTSNATGATAPVAANKGHRVHAVIQPKGKDGATGAAKPAGKSVPDPAPLKSVTEIANPRQE